MSEIQYDQGSSTVSQIILTGLGIVLMTTLQTPPVRNAAMQSNKPLLQKYYSLDGNEPTYNSYASIITGEYITKPMGFEQSVGSFYARLLTSQEPLGAEFEKVLYENLWDLYES